jgi:hypothetical protein
MRPFVIDTCAVEPWFPSVGSPISSAIALNGKHEEYPRYKTRPLPSAGALVPILLHSVLPVALHALFPLFPTRLPTLLDVSFSTSLRLHPRVVYLETSTPHPSVSQQFARLDAMHVLRLIVASQLASARLPTLSTGSC